MALKVEDDKLFVAFGYVLHYSIYSVYMYPMSLIRVVYLSKCVVEKSGISINSL